MKKILLWLSLLVPLASFAQNENDLSNKDQKRNRPAYLGITLGMCYSGFRDFATSPLTYNGSPLYISLSHLKGDSKRESEFGLSYSFGNYIKGFNHQFAESRVGTTSLYYSKLYGLHTLSTQQFNIKIGGLIHTTYNSRYNESFVNNEAGRELFINLLGSIEITKDVSRKENKDKKFLFINYRLNQRTRDLSFRLNLGLINCSYRNGYSYMGNNVDPTEINPYDGYQFKVFSGYRMSTALDYTIFLKNKNAVQLSYLWDAYKTGGDLDKFEMAHHIFKVTLLFKTNNR
jgi:hypothetical protein